MAMPPDNEKRSLKNKNFLAPFLKICQFVVGSFRNVCLLIVVSPWSGCHGVDSGKDTLWCVFAFPSMTMWPFLAPLALTVPSSSPAPPSYRWVSLEWRSRRSSYVDRYGHIEGLLWLAGSPSEAHLAGSTIYIVL